MAELHCNLREEQTAYCKILGLLGKCAQEIKTELNFVYGEHALHYHTSDRGVSIFKEGTTNVKDDPRPRRPISAISEKDICTVKAIVDEDARFTVEEISVISGLSVSYVFSILKEKFKLRKVCACYRNQKGGGLKKPRPYLLGSKIKTPEINCHRE
jgi:hypothetical protein